MTTNIENKILSKIVFDTRGYFELTVFEISELTYLSKNLKKCLMFHLR